MPLRALLLIGALVLIVHLLLLQALPSAPLAAIRPPMKAFTTRTVTLNAPPPKPEAAPKPAPPPKPNPPLRKPRPATQPAATAPPPLAAAATQPQAPAEPAASAPEPMPAASEAVANAKPEAPAPESAPVPPPREVPVGANVLAIPGSVRITYDMTGEVKRLSYSANAQLLWMQDGSNYDAILEVKAFLLGSASQMSSGQITAEGLAPLRFADKRRTEVAAHFERDKGKVTFSANTPDAPLLAGAQDRLSVIFQLVAMFAGEPDKYPPATTITLQIVGPRDAELWLFTVDGEETLNLAHGAMQAIKVSRNPRKEFDQKIEVWFAPSLGYLPVRLRITQANGDFVDQKLQEVAKP
ncbi:hypothetical protein RD110_02015 [Rhodoferax koreense]|uniref:DUF3108 domain-containing protein n=1 Tax=Rhodoferax koreensis TaxID=1842727 RepID=A0A1P8K322_9BURK|nr:hypothetical protein RD110_02015 [Rhodoferax koreense]